MKSARAHATITKLPERTTPRVSALQKVAQMNGKLGERFDLSRGFVPIVLVVGMIGTACAGAWWASGVSAELQSLGKRLEPLGELPSMVSDNAKDVETLEKEVARLERDLAVAQSRIHHLSVEVGIQKKMEELDAQR